MKRRILADLFEFGGVLSFGRRLRSPALGLGWAMASLGAAACTTIPTPMGTTAAPSALPTTTTDDGAGSLARGVFRSKRFGLTVALPPEANHRIDDRTTSWLTVESDDGSTLLVRHWKSDNRRTPAKCEEEARALRTLPTRERLEVVDERDVDAPPGLGTRAALGVLEGKNGAVFGAILAFGGSGRRCFAFVYATRAVPAATSDARATVGQRLAWMAENSLATLRFESDLDLLLERESSTDPTTKGP